MPAFDHRDPGTSAAAWATRLHDLDLSTWDGWRSASGVVVLSPHPDDESLGVGGLIAAAAAAGIPVQVLLVTLGEGSHPDSPTRTPAELAPIREAEFVDALGRLHPGVGYDILRIPDGGLDGQRPRIAEALRAAVGAAGEAPLIVAPWRGDGHRDHRVAGELATALATELDLALAEFPIWLWHWADTDDETLPWADARTVGLDADAHGAKIAAMDAYPSQTEPLSAAPGDEAIVDHHHLQHYARRFEVVFPNARALELGAAGRVGAGQDGRALDAGSTQVSGAGSTQAFGGGLTHVSGSGSTQVSGAGSTPGSDAGSTQIFGAALTQASDAASTPASGGAPARVSDSVDEGSSRSQQSFDDHYREHPDGWDFGSWYEERKRQVLLAALPRPRYGAVLELGCATGVLTGRLAERSDDVLGIDIVDAPLKLARRAVPSARFERRTLPDEWPAGSFDLVVVSEVGYYLSETDLERLIDRILGSLASGGSVVACHWRHPDDHATTSAALVHQRLLERWPGRRSVRHEEDDFLLDVLVDASELNVAAHEGLTG